MWANGCRPCFVASVERDGKVTLSAHPTRRGGQSGARPRPSNETFFLPSTDTAGSEEREKTGEERGALVLLGADDARRRGRVEERGPFGCACGFNFLALCTGDGKLFAKRVSLSGHGMAGIDGNGFPPQISQVFLRQRVLEVSAGWHHCLLVCGAEERGRKCLFAFGDNSFGQCGLGEDSVSSFVETPTRVRLLASSSSSHRGEAGDEEVESAACGAFHSAAVMASGSVYLWGEGAHGRLGLGEGVVAGCVRAPEGPLVLPGGGVSSAHLGSNFSVLVGRNRSVLFVFGANAHGQLGLGDRRERHVPVRLRSRKGSDDAGVQWKSVGCGALCVCALDTRGRVWGWGRGLRGESAGEDSDVPRILPLDSLTRGRRVNNLCAGGSVVGLSLYSPNASLQVSRQRRSSHDEREFESQITKFCSETSKEKWAAAAELQEAAGRRKPLEQRILLSESGSPKRAGKEKGPLKITPSRPMVSVTVNSSFPLQTTQPSWRWRMVAERARAVSAADRKDRQPPPPSSGTVSPERAARQKGLGGRVEASVLQHLRGDGSPDAVVSSFLGSLRQSRQNQRAVSHLDPFSLARERASTSAAAAENEGQSDGGRISPSSRRGMRGRDLSTEGERKKKSKQKDTEPRSLSSALSNRKGGKKETNRPNPSVPIRLQLPSYRAPLSSRIPTHEGGRAAQSEKRDLIKTPLNIPKEEDHPSTVLTFSKVTPLSPPTVLTARGRNASPVASLHPPPLSPHPADPSPQKQDIWRRARPMSAKEPPPFSSLARFPSPVPIEDGYPSPQRRRKISPSRGRGRHTRQRGPQQQPVSPPPSRSSPALFSPPPRLNNREASNKPSPPDLKLTLPPSQHSLRPPLGGRAHPALALSSLEAPRMTTPRPLSASRDPSQARTHISAAAPLGSSESALLSLLTRAGPSSRSAAVQRHRESSLRRERREGLRSPSRAGGFSPQSLRSGAAAAPSVSRAVSVREEREGDGDGRNGINGSFDPKFSDLQASISSLEHFIGSLPRRLKEPDPQLVFSEVVASAPLSARFFGEHPPQPATGRQRGQFGRAAQAKRYVSIFSPRTDLSSKNRSMPFGAVRRRADSATISEVPPAAAAAALRAAPQTYVETGAAMRGQATLSPPKGKHPFRGAVQGPDVGGGPEVQDEIVAAFERLDAFRREKGGAAGERLDEDSALLLQPAGGASGDGGDSEEEAREYRLFSNVLRPAPLQRPHTMVSPLSPTASRKSRSPQPKKFAAGLVQATSPLSPSHTAKQTVPPQPKPQPQMQRERDTVVLSPPPGALSRSPAVPLTSDEAEAGGPCGYYPELIERYGMLLGSVAQSAWKRREQNGVRGLVLSNRRRQTGTAEGGGREKKREASGGADEKAVHLVKDWKQSRGKEKDTARKGERRRSSGTSSSSLQPAEESRGDSRGRESATDVERKESRLTHEEGASPQGSLEDRDGGEKEEAQRSDRRRSSSSLSSSVRQSAPRRSSSSLQSATSAKARTDDPHASATSQSVEMPNTGGGGGRGDSREVEEDDESTTAYRQWVASSSASSPEETEKPRLSSQGSAKPIEVRSQSIGVDEEKKEGESDQLSQARGGEIKGVGEGGEESISLTEEEAEEEEEGENEDDSLPLPEEEGEGNKGALRGFRATNGGSVPVQQRGHIGGVPLSLSAVPLVTEGGVQRRGSESHVKSSMLPASMQRSATLEVGSSASGEGFGLVSRLSSLKEKGKVEKGLDAVTSSVTAVPLALSEKFAEHVQSVAEEASASASSVLKETKAAAVTVERQAENVVERGRSAVADAAAESAQLGSLSLSATRSREQAVSLAGEFVETAEAAADTATNQLQQTVAAADQISVPSIGSLQVPENIPTVTVVPPSLTPPAVPVQVQQLTTEVEGTVAAAAKLGSTVEEKAEEISKAAATVPDAVSDAHRTVAQVGESVLQSEKIAETHLPVQQLTSADAVDLLKPAGDAVPEDAKERGAAVLSLSRKVQVAGAFKF
uniref:Regulator of chromosome condensation (RCC1) repeat-containing protein n=1 Tax=Chromera velia CCMP2878 TaxID=1169474 RepID=A0A0G4IEK2_9ALVE|eukprot:Cvel_13658.t1-p1 / transcript=Cvel_13658.t1 / gene=Cvel_13658 / organism=Chromera_velia_CCMP2878 / gene_product=Probable E3 ubiquitin-protein ligase HERC3, putative / transcript_product=Probable E3 ubiquitin-protein ligase HERC3, putative / location=Cvel_scaffold942:43810-51187(+) / protein_length=1987 / sequence_SO=supercontig / SO=protein_coding / is_pseudo=false